jgi:AAA15 family ATPase/GTPase
MAVNVVNLLNDNDIPVTTIRSTNISQTLLPAKEQPRTTLTHKTALGEAQFDFDEESEGTKNLFGFAIPWRLARNSSVFAIDEFDSSLHPDIVTTLVRKHIESDTPTQLIFTTHDTHLMTTKLLRRDQFWLTERDANGATQLRAIHDFEGSEDEDLEKRYFEGRYRALPLVRRG